LSFPGQARSRRRRSRPCLFRHRQAGVAGEAGQGFTKAKPMSPSDELAHVTGLVEDAEGRTGKNRQAGVAGEAGRRALEGAGPDAAGSCLPGCCLIRW